VGEQVTRVGIVGTGVISATYLDHLGKLPGVDVVAVADVARAQAIADKNPAIRALSPDDLYAADDVDIVLNLTIPAAHAAVHQAAMEAGKHVYGEKPLAVDRAEAEPLLKYAAANNLRVGCAPDTVLGTGTQTARVAIDRGDIGVPLRPRPSSHPAMSCGTRRRSSTTSPAAVRSSTWVRTT
jgi:predicted dehydrogenase